MIVLGPATLLALVLCLRNWRVRMPWLLSGSLIMPNSAAVAAGGIALSPYFVIASALAVMVGWSWLRGQFTFPRSTLITMLVVFLGWCYLITAVGPAVFAGETVLNQSSTSDGFVTFTALAYSVTNVAQLAYLSVSVVVILFIASRPRLSPHLLLPGLAMAMAMSFWRLLHDRIGLPYPTVITDGSYYHYIDINTDSAYRLRGVFSEPSYLAHYATATLAMCLVMLYRGQSLKLRLVYLVVAALSAVNIVFASSGTALVGGTVVGIGVTIAVAIRAFRSYAGTVSISLTACGLVVIGLLAFDRISRYATNLLNDKLGSGSYNQRTGGDLYSLDLASHLYGLGVGLGSNKSSSMWPMLLSCVGIFGTALFAVIIFVALRGAIRYPLVVGAERPPDADS